MKGIVPVLIIISFLQFKSAPPTEHTGFKILLQQKANDTLLYKRLLRFEKQGIEKHLKTNSASADALIDTAMTYLGTPHCMGGLTHNCIDCSGLLYISFKKTGVKVPHNSEDLARYGKIIPYIDSLKRGDLVFFVNTYPTQKLITHSGIYLDSCKFIHTSSTRGVVISDLQDKYYKEHFIFGTRIFNEQNDGSKAN